MMQIILHAGAHFTDDDRLIKCLLKNTEVLSKEGVSVPGPGKYRNLLRSTLNAMKDTAPAPDAGLILTDAILDNTAPERVVLSNAHFFGAPRAALRYGTIYPSAGRRMADLQLLFPADHVELFLAIRNPAGFLPAIYTHSPREGLEDFLDGCDPQSIHWSNTIIDLREALPEMPITVWCNEDTPYIWSQIVRDLCGVGPDIDLVGVYDFLSDIMSDEGMSRLQSYMAERPQMTEAQERRVIAAFLEKFAIDDKIEEELDLPGWTDMLVEELTELYDRDVSLIETIPGVRLIMP